MHCIARQSRMGMIRAVFLCKENPALDAGFDLSQYLFQYSELRAISSQRLVLPMLCSGRIARLCHLHIKKKSVDS